MNLFNQILLQIKRKSYEYECKSFSLTISHKKTFLIYVSRYDGLDLKDFSIICVTVSFRLFP